MKLHKPIQIFPLNNSGKDYFVGDIHGHHSLFKLGLSKLNFNPEQDRVFSVGDLIDRGSQNIKCLRLLNSCWFNAVVGNHEMMFLEFADGKRGMPNFENRWQYGLTDSELAECTELISQMHVAMEVETEIGKVGVIHAGIPNGISWNNFIAKIESGCDESINFCTWDRSIVDSIEYETVGIDKVIIGHQALDKPTNFGDIICLDSCAFMSNLYCKTYGLTFAYIENGSFKFVTIPNN